MRKIIVCSAGITPEHIASGRDSAGVVRTIPSVLTTTELLRAFSLQVKRSVGLTQAKGVHLLAEPGLAREFLDAIEGGATMAGVPFTQNTDPLEVVAAPTTGIISCIEHRIVPLVNKHCRSNAAWHVTFPGSGASVFDPDGADYVRAVIRGLREAGVTRFIMVKNQYPLVMSQPDTAEHNEEVARERRRASAKRSFMMLRPYTTGADLSFGFVNHHRRTMTSLEGVALVA